MRQTKRVLAFLAACFGIGALAMPEPAQAFAFECTEAAFWKVHNPVLEGDGSDTARAREAEFWDHEMWLHDDGEAGATLEFSDDSAVIELRRVR